ncbi:MAG: non-ribosomal peptide synthetase, partial [bacterium]|nr:non-ribosomal peptide synthetase [bacterium]
RIDDILMTALGLAIKKTFGNEKVVVALEGHGREEILKNIDIKRTVGWFTSVYPVVLDLSYYAESGGEHPARQVKEIKESLHRVPNRGVGHGILKHLTMESHRQEVEFKLNPQFSFNYLGQSDAEAGQMTFDIAEESAGNTVATEWPREADFDVSGIIAGKQLRMSVTFSREQYRSDTVETLSAHFKAELSRLIDFCSSYPQKELTPSDLTYKKLPIEVLDKLQKEYAIEDIYPLAPMQEGLLFHFLFEKNPSLYFEQISYRLYQKLDVNLVEKSVNELLKRYDILRAAFLYDEVERPIQVIRKNRRVDFCHEDIGRHSQDPDKIDALVKEYKGKDRMRSFELNRDVLMRVAVLQVNPEEYEFIWSFHHILLDGWCVGILISELFEIYSSLQENRPHRLKPATPYRLFIQWLDKQDRNQSKNYWRQYLEGYSEAVSIPGAVSPDTPQAYKNEEVVFAFEKEIGDGLQELAGRKQVTLYTVIQAIWVIVLGKYNDKQDVVFGGVVSGRPPEIEDVETMVGLFINTIPVRIQFGGDTVFSRLLNKIQKEAIGSEAHQYFSLAEIQAESTLKQNLLDHILVFENYPVARQIEKTAGKIKLKEEFYEYSNYNFNVVVNPGDPLRIRFGYNANVYKRDFVEEVGKQISNIAQQVIQDNDIRIKDMRMIHHLLEIDSSLSDDGEGDFEF